MTIQLFTIASNLDGFITYLTRCVFEPFLSQVYITLRKGKSEFHCFKLMVNSILVFKIKFLSAHLTSTIIDDIALSLSQISSSSLLLYLSICFWVIIHRDKKAKLLLRRRSKRVATSKRSWRNGRKAASSIPTSRSSLVAAVSWPASHLALGNAAAPMGNKTSSFFFRRFNKSNSLSFPSRAKLCFASRISYILEGKELEFYMKKIQRKKGKGAGAAA